MTQVAEEISAAEVGALVARLTHMYDVDPAPARAKLEQVAGKLFDCPLEGLTLSQAAELDRHIRSGFIRTEIELFELKEADMGMQRYARYCVYHRINRRVDSKHLTLEAAVEAFDKSFRRWKSSAADIELRHFNGDTQEVGDVVDPNSPNGRPKDIPMKPSKRNGSDPANGNGAAIAAPADLDLHEERDKRARRAEVREFVEKFPGREKFAAEQFADGKSLTDDIRMIPVDKIVQSTFNPRRDFNETGIAALAEQLKAQGQLHNLVVRPHTLAGHFEIVCGERRWRAAQLLGWKELRCLVKSIDLGAAAVDALIENVGAQSLNAIEEAIGYKQVIDTGVTHTALGKMLGISQGQVSNRLRLLDLPAEWQARVISREMPATHARELTAWSHRPAVLEEVDREIRGRRLKLEEMSLNDFTDVIRYCVREVSRPMSGHFQFDVRGHWRSGEVAFKPTPEERAQLDVEEIRTGRGKAGKSERCFNVKLWDELQAKAEQVERERHAKQLDRANKAGKAKRTPAQDKARREKLEKQYQGRLQRWKTKWLQQRIAERIDNLDAPMASRLVLFFAFQQNNLRRRDADDESTLFEQLVVANKGQHVTQGDRYWNYTDYWRTIASVGDAGVRHVANGLLRAWVCHDTESFQADIKAGDVDAIAETLGVDVAKEWKLSRDFLELHTTDQLRELAKEWHLPSEHIAGSTKRKDLIEAVLVYVDQVKCPQRLLPAKRGGKKKKGGKR